MVASADAVPLKPKKLLRGTKERFAVAVGNGASFKAGYRIATGNTNAGTCEVEGHHMARDPAVMARIEEIRQLNAEAASMPMRERLALLADTARRKIREAPSHTERIGAIREYSIHTGERRTDSSQISIAAEVSIVAVLGALNGFGSPRATEPRTVSPVTGGVAQSAERAADVHETREVIGSTPFPVHQSPVMLSSLQDPWEIAAELPLAPAQPMAMVEIDEDGVE